MRCKVTVDTSHYPKEELPIGWVISDLDSLCTTINGLWKGEKEPLVKVGVIRNANFTKDFTLDYSKIEYIDVELSSFEKRNLENGDIIVEKSGGSDNYPVGRSILYQGENGIYSFSNFTMSLRIVDKQALLPKYLYYVLQQKYRQGDMKHMQTQTTGLHNLLSEIYLSMPIPIPPREEQERIVDSIDSLLNVVSEIECTQIKCVKEIESAKAKVLDLAIHGKLVPQDPSDEPAIELLKRINPDFKPSHNLHYTGLLPRGWIKCRLADICDILDSHRKPVNSKERSSRIESASSLYPYFGATGQVGFIDDYIFDGSFILLGEDGAPFLERNANKAYQVQGKIWVNNHAHVLAPKVNFEYILFHLNGIDYRRYVTGTTRLKLTQEAMKSIEIALPPLKEQNRIVLFVKQALSLLDRLRNGVQDCE